MYLTLDPLSRRYKSKEQKRCQHPIQVKIPYHGWYYVFHEKLSNELQRLMQKADPDALLKEYLASNPSYWEKKRYFLSIASVHPEYTDAQLKAFANKLNLSARSLFVYAAMLGRANLSQQILSQASPADILDIIKTENYLAFLSAVRGGHHEIVLQLIKIIPSDYLQEMLQVGYYQPLVEAIIGNHLTIIDSIFDHVPIVMKHDMIQTNNYYVFRLAVDYGHVEIVNRFLDFVDDNEKRLMVKTDNYKVFRMAAEKGRIDVIDKLIALSQEFVDTPAKVVNQSIIHDNSFAQLIDPMSQAFDIGCETPRRKMIGTFGMAMIKAENYGAFCSAVRIAHIDIMERLIAITPEHRVDMVLAGNCKAFNWAVNAGHLDVVYRLLDLVPRQKWHHMIRASGYLFFNFMVTIDDFDAVDEFIKQVYGDWNYFIQEHGSEIFRAAAGLGRLDLFDKLVELDAENGGEVISTDSYKLLWQAVSHGRLDIINRLNQLLTPAHWLSAIQAENYTVINRAVQAGHLDIVNRLFESAPAHQVSMIEAIDFGIVQPDNFDIFNHLIELSPVYRSFTNIQAKGYRVIFAAAEAGRLDIVMKLLSFAGKNSEQVIQAAEYEVFHAAVRGGHLEILNQLLAISKTHLDRIIQAGNYKIFRAAAAYGHLDIIRRLIEVAPEHKAHMIKANNYYAFVEAARSGHLDVVEVLIELVDPAQLQKMLQADPYIIQENRYGALQWAFRFDDSVRVVERLLNFPDVFFYAASSGIFTAPVNQFISNKLTAFKTRQMTGHAHIILTQQEAKIGYLILLLVQLNVIQISRRDFDFLMKITVLQTIPNEPIFLDYRNNIRLLNKAIGEKQEAIYKRLLEIPEMLEVAKTHLQRSEFIKKLIQDSEFRIQTQIRHIRTYMPPLAEPIARYDLLPNDPTGQLLLDLEDRLLNKISCGLSSFGIFSDLKEKSSEEAALLKPS